MTLIIILLERVEFKDDKSCENIYSSSNILLRDS